jgi:HPt (histidine-containing phosphotransfer) domain-containing protein
MRKASESKASEAIFDKEHLAAYTFGDRQLESEVLSMFMEQAALLQERLRGAEDGRQWREAAHSLKGSARGIGAFALGSMAERLEKAHDGLAAPDREAALDSLQAMIDETGQAISAHLSRSAG